MAEMSEDPGPRPRHAPKFDIYGWEIKAKTAPNTDRLDVKLPPGWNYAPSKLTQKTLLEQRKKGNLPDISFDLDRDNIVSGEDLVIGKRFDLDKDGRLNTSERKAADEAVKNGIADKFVWGIEQAAPTRPYRIMQKRGQIVDAEDFSKVAETYPPKPRSTTPPIKTYAQLQAVRAQERLQSLKTYREDWDKRHPQQLIPETQEYRKSTLPYRTYSEKRDIERKDMRVKAGLSPTCKDISERKDPGLNYVPLPRYRSKSQMRTVKQTETLQDYATKQNQSFISSDQRLQLREDELLLPPNPVPGKTHIQLKEKLKKDTIDHHKTVFSTVKVGIHGSELPKFAEEKVEYWKEAPGYVAEPVIQSRLELEQRKKYWAPRDIYRLADKESTAPPPDPFKSTHVAQVRPNEPVIPAKPTEYVPIPYVPKDLSDPNAPAAVKHTYRWTTLMQVFNRNLMRPVGRKETGKKEKMQE